MMNSWRRSTRWSRSGATRAASEAIRELLREAAKQDHANEGRAPCVATLTYVYDHSVRDLSQRIVAAQHDHHDLSIATTHVHFDHDSCLEVTILRGRADAIQTLGGQPDGPARCAARQPAYDPDEALGTSS